MITPSLNQGRFIEATIRSVLLQGYPNLEYLIIDGGSTDGTIDILRRYDRFLTGWVGESDRGQADAMNKGLARSTGDLEGYQNADDGYFPGALRIAAERYLAGHDFIYGHHIGHTPDGRELLRETLPRMHPHRYVIYASGSLFPEATFWARRLREKVGLFKELRYSLDTEWFYRMTEKCRNPCHVHEYLAWFTEHENRKTLESDGAGRRIGLRYEEHPLAAYLRERRISRLRQIAGGILYIPWKRLHQRRFPLPLPKWRILKRLLHR